MKFKKGEMKMKQLVECIEMRPGITTFIGAGGKTSSIFQIASELKKQNRRIIVTTTTKMYYPGSEQLKCVLIDPSEKEVQQALNQFGTIAIGGSHQKDKITGVSDEQIQMMQKYAEYILVEGDGSKHLPLKVPAEHEPVIPEAAEKVIIVVGMKALNQPVAACCFRKEKVMELLKVKEDHVITTSDIAEIVISTRGLQKGIGNRKQVLLINQADVLEDQETINELIKKLKDKYKHNIVVAALNKKSWIEV